MPKSITFTKHARKVTPLTLPQFIFKTSGKSNTAADMNTFDLNEIMQTNNLLYDKYEVIPLYVN